MNHKAFLLVLLTLMAGGLIGYLLGTGRVLVVEETSLIPAGAGASADGPGLAVGSAGFTGDDGVSTNPAGANGVHVNHASKDGLFVCTTGSETICTVRDNQQNGVEIGSAQHYGIRIDDAGYTGVHVGSAGDDGVSVSAAGFDGIFVGSVGDDGMYVGSAGDDGVDVYSAADDGVDVYSAGGDGFAVCSTGTEPCTGGLGFGNNGLEIGNAETHGIRVASTGLDGLAVVEAGRYGVNVAGNTLAGYFDGGIQVVNGSCTGCRLAAFARNSGATALRPGDIVALHRLTPSSLGSTPVLMEVGRAGRDEPLVGVVEGRAELVAVQDARPYEPGQRLVPREGPAGPGQYVTIIIYGLAQVRASAVDERLVRGSRVAVNTDGAGRTLRSLEIDGVALAENAPTIGTALERLEAGREGLIWVLVNPR